MNDQSTYLQPHIILLQRASSLVLTEQIPDDWNDLSLQDQDEFLESNVCEATEDYDAEGLWGLILEKAEEMERLLEQVKKGLINMAINCQLDGDMNHLDMDTVLTHSMRDTQEVVDGKFN